MVSFTTAVVSTLGADDLPRRGQLLPDESIGHRRLPAAAELRRSISSGCPGRFPSALLVFLLVSLPTTHLGVVDTTEVNRVLTTANSTAAALVDVAVQAVRPGWR